MASSFACPFASKQASALAKLHPAPCMISGFISGSLNLSTSPFFLKRVSSQISATMLRFKIISQGKFLLSSFKTLASSIFGVIMSANLKSSFKLAIASSSRSFEPDFATQTGSITILMPCL